jgi:F1F0 ATPase subunit 2
MNDALNLVSALAAGFFLGAFFFGGLWLTVQRGRPALWFLGSLLLRTGISVAGFCLASGGHLERLLICLFGFFVMRSVVLRFTRLPEEESNQLTKEASHAN